jgi:hypothetical protein
VNTIDQVFAEPRRSRGTGRRTARPTSPSPVRTVPRPCAVPHPPRLRRAARPRSAPHGRRPREVGLRPGALERPRGGRDLGTLACHPGARTASGRSALSDAGKRTARRRRLRSRPAWAARRVTTSPPRCIRRARSETQPTRLCRSPPPAARRDAGPERRGPRLLRAGRELSGRAGRAARRADRVRVVAAGTRRARPTWPRLRQADRQAGDLHGHAGARRDPRGRGRAHGAAGLHADDPVRGPGRAADKGRGAFRRSTTAPPSVRSPSTPTSWTSPAHRRGGDRAFAHRSAGPPGPRGLALPEDKLHIDGGPPRPAPVTPARAGLDRAALDAIG